jgi:hypothetical protein
VPYLYETSVGAWNGTNPPPLVSTDANGNTVLATTDVPVPNLVSDLPEYEQAAMFVVAYLYAIGQELQRVEYARQALMKSWTPFNADMLLEFYEQIVGVTPNPSGMTLQQRQALVLSKMQAIKAEGTGLSWQALMTQFLGTPNWTYQEHVADGVANGTFEADTAGSTPANWRVGTGSSGSPTFHASAGWSEGGTQSAQFTCTSTAAGYEYFEDVASGSTFPTGYMPVLPGEEYTASADFNVTATTGGGALIGIEWYTASGAAISPNNYLAVTGTGVHLSQELTVTAPATAAYALLIIGAQATATSQTNTFYVDNVQFVAGATKVSPNPPSKTIQILIPSSANENATRAFARLITPAHLAITVGFLGGFILGVSELGDPLG